MKTWKSIRGHPMDAARRALPVFCIGLLAIGAAFAGRSSAPSSLEVLDPAFMHAVTATVSQHDVRAILAHQHSTAPVHLRLFTSCDNEQHCTILTAMDFPASAAPASAISLRVAVHVSPDEGSARVASTWEVQSNHSTGDQPGRLTGDFHDLAGVPAIGEQRAIANLLTSMQSAIGEVLDANGVSTQHPPAPRLLAGSPDASL